MFIAFLSLNRCPIFGVHYRANLRVLCTACNQARANIQPPTETAKNLITRIRKQGRSIQKEVYEALRRTFGNP